MAAPGACGTLYQVFSVVTKGKPVLLFRKESILISNMSKTLILHHYRKWIFPWTASDTVCDMFYKPLKACLELQLQQTCPLDRQVYIEPRTLSGSSTIS